MSAPAGIAVRTDGPGGCVTVVELATPESRNALTPAISRSLRALFDADEPGAIVLTGQGRSFCSGGNLAELQTASEEGRLPELVAGTTDEYGELLRSIASSPRPTVAAVNGAAAGGGLCLALACDVRVASTAASIVPAFLRLGAVPTGGATWLLASALGPALARSVLLTGRAIRPGDALAPLLFDEVVEPDTLVARAVEVAASMAPLNRHAVAQARHLLATAPSHTLSEHLDAERRAQLVNVRRPEFAAGIAAFLRKD